MANEHDWTEAAEAAIWGGADLKGLISTRLAMMRADAAAQALAACANGVAMIGRAGMVTLSAAPLPMHVSRARRRLRRQQAQFVTDWHRRCHLRSAAFFKASLLSSAAAIAAGPMLPAGRLDRVAGD